MIQQLVRFGVFAVVVVSFPARPIAFGEGKQANEGFEYPRLVLHGKLATTLVIDHCEYISGMTCRIRLKETAALPSRVFFTEYDSAGKQVGRKVRLIYPKLNPGESGKATFRLRSSIPSKIVLRGEWKGPWRDPY
jgi:hypothetical protein